jgi:hypothetical protein
MHKKKFFSNYVIASIHTSPYFGGQHSRTSLTLTLATADAASVVRSKQSRPETCRKDYRLVWTYLLMRGGYFHRKQSYTIAF